MLNFKGRCIIWLVVYKCMSKVREINWQSEWLLVNKFFRSSMTLYWWTHVRDVYVLFACRCYYWFPWTKSEHVLDNKLLHLFRCSTYSLRSVGDCIEKAEGPCSRLTLCHKFARDWHPAEILLEFFGLLSSRCCHCRLGFFLIWVDRVRPTCSAILLLIRSRSYFLFPSIPSIFVLCNLASNLADLDGFTWGPLLY